MAERFDLVLTTTLKASSSEAGYVWILSGIGGRRNTRFELVLTAPLELPGHKPPKRDAKLANPYGKGAVGQAIWIGDDAVSISAQVSPAHWQERHLSGCSRYGARIELDGESRVTNLSLQPYEAKPEGSSSKKSRGKDPRLS